jgi:uncharacterized protein GlcG (DUF336 family)
MARRTAMSRLLPTLAGLLAAAALLAGAGCAKDEAATTPAATSTVAAPIADISTIGIDPWLKIIGTRQSQTREGLSIKMDGVAIGTAESVLGALGISSGDLGNDWADAKAVIAIAFEAHNTTSSTITVPIHTNAKIVANDEQSGTESHISDVETSIQPGARRDMRVAVPISRYSAEEIESVRFVLDMSASSSPDTTFQFEVAVP